VYISILKTTTPSTHGWACPIEEKKMKKSKALLLVTGAFLLALSGTSFAHDGPWENSQGQGEGGKSGHHTHCRQHPLFTEAQKDLLRSTHEQVHNENKPLMDKLHLLHKEMTSLVKTDTFDQQAFLDKSSEVEKLHDQITENRVRAFVGIAPQFSPEERKFLFRMAMRSHRHRHHHGHHLWQYKGGKQSEGNQGDKPAQPDNMPQSDAAPAQ
jgi:Spy/CpxP family protein refolding chaperone